MWQLLFAERGKSLIVMQALQLCAWAHAQIHPFSVFLWNFFAPSTRRHSTVYLTHSNSGVDFKPELVTIEKNQYKWCIFKCYCHLLIVGDVNFFSVFCLRVSIASWCGNSEVQCEFSILHSTLWQRKWLITRRLAFTKGWVVAHDKYLFFCVVSVQS